MQAQKILTQAPLLMGCCTNEGLDMLSLGQQTQALDAGLMAAASGKGKEALFWQMKAEPLSAKGASVVCALFTPVNTARRFTCPDPGVE